MNPAVNIKDSHLQALPQLKLHLSLIKLHSTCAAHQTCHASASSPAPRTFHDVRRCAGVHLRLQQRALVVAGEPRRRPHRAQLQRAAALTRLAVVAVVHHVRLPLREGPGSTVAACFGRQQWLRFCVRLGYGLCLACLWQMAITCRMTPDAQMTEIDNQTSYLTNLTERPLRPGQ